MRGRKSGAGIPLALVEAVLRKPDQIVPEKGTVKAHQSRCEMGGKIFLLRVLVDDSMNLAVVVTVYRTTKIEKYWVTP